MQVDVAGAGGCLRTGEEEGETGGAGVEIGEDLVEEVETGVEGVAGDNMSPGLSCDNCGIDFCALIKIL